MIRNYFILSRLTSELNVLLTGSRMLSSFSQEKDKMIIECRKNNNDLFIEISVNPQFPYITVKDKFSRGKKNTAELFAGLLPAVINSISIAHYDRIIRITTEGGELYFYIRGNKTNVIAAAEGRFSSFKKMNEDEISLLINGFKSIQYTDSPVQFHLPDEEKISDKDLLKKYPFIGKEVITETKVRDYENGNEGLSEVISDLLNNTPAVFTGEDEVKLAVEGFRSYNDYKSELFDNMIQAVNQYIVKKYSTEYFYKKKKSLLSAIENELERTASRINNLKGRIDAGSREEEYNKYGNLLLINLDMFEKGSSEIKVEDIYSNNEELKIKIDPSLSPQKNADRYFDKARNERIGYSKSKELYSEYTLKYAKLKENHSVITEINTPEELRKMDTSKKDNRRYEDKDDLADKFRQYIIEGKYKLYVGKDSEKNDLLTTRFAKQNDYWFHARGVSGSHVILRIDNTKEPVPKSILKKAASIAAFHSKAKTASLVPVAYTLKKYVVKKKGMETGKVALMREEVLLVKPEVPQGCEYISKE